MKIERLSAKAEDYLETILRPSETLRGARTGDIAEALNVQPPTVSAALKSLDAILTHTPMLANRNAASTIQRACIGL